MGDPISAAVTDALFEGGKSAIEKFTGVEAAEDAARDRRRASTVAAARDENERQASIRQQFRQERIRRASIIASSEASGGSGGSMAIGGIGAGQTIAAQGQAFATGQSLAADVQTNFLQSAASSEAESAKKSAITNFAITAAAFAAGG